MKIVPAILAKTEEEYSNNLKEIEDSKGFDGEWIHIDLMDDKFVPNESIKASVIGKYPSKFKKEVHLMVRYPENWMDELFTTDVKCIVFPVEDDSGTLERITDLKNHGVEVGLSINPETPIEKLEPFLPQIDVVLVMAVHPGFQGQQFISEVLEKVKELVSKKGNFIIEVDGGVDAQNAKMIVDAGADYLVVGSHLLEGNIDENLEEFKKALQ